jgi:hypothetical protein
VKVGTINETSWEALKRSAVTCWHFYGNPREPSRLANAAQSGTVLGTSRSAASQVICFHLICHRTDFIEMLSFFKAKIEIADRSGVFCFLFKLLFTSE